MPTDRRTPEQKAAQEKERDVYEESTGRVYMEEKKDGEMSDWDKKHFANTKQRERFFSEYEKMLSKDPKGAEDWKERTLKEYEALMKKPFQGKVL